MTDLPGNDDVKNAPDQSHNARLPSNLFAFLSADVEQPARKLPNGKFVTTLTLNSRTCRWPIGDPRDSDFHYCGQRPKAGVKYCDTHERRSRQALRSRANHRPPPLTRSR